MSMADEHAVEQEQEQEKAPVQKYVLDNGQEASRSEYIRQEFLKNKGRSEIAKELEVSYNIVFSATANMYNEKHPEGEGRKGGRSIMVKDPRDENAPERPRSEIMKEMYAEGYTRSEIAVQFEVPYATVYGATKDIEPPEGTKTHGGKVMIEHPETGEQVARVDYIREQFAAGKKRREIANELTVDYSVVWMATRPEKDEEGEEGEEESPDLEEDEF